MTTLYRNIQQVLFTTAFRSNWIVESVVLRQGEKKNKDQAKIETGIKTDHSKLSPQMTPCPYFKPVSAVTNSAKTAI